MSGLLKNKTLLFALLGVGVAAFVWYGMLDSNSEGPLLTTQNVGGANEADSEVVRVLLQLRAISLAGTVFSDPAFISLKDFGQDIIPEPVGRPNPFAPLGVVSQPAQAPQSSGLVQ